MILLAQWQRIQTLTREGEVFSRSQTQPSSLTNSLHSTLFSQSPFPAILVNYKGELIWSNPHFWQRFGQDFQSLKEIDQKLHTNFQTLPFTVSSHHLAIDLPAQNVSEAHKRRVYTVITWPVKDGRKDGLLLMLIEQTAVQQRRHQTAAFEHQMIRYLDSLSQQLHQPNIQDKPAQLEKVNDELDALRSLLTTHHTSVRRQNTHDRINLAVACKEVLSAIGPELQKRQLHLISTLPHSAEAFIHQDDAKLSLTLIMEALIELTRPGMSLRFQLEKHAKHTSVVLTVPELLLQPQHVKIMFAFGTTTQRTALFAGVQMKLSLARQMVLKYHGHIGLSSEEHMGTRIELIFASAEA